MNAPGAILVVVVGGAAILSQVGSVQKSHRSYKAKSAEGIQGAYHPLHDEYSLLPASFGTQISYADSYVPEHEARYNNITPFPSDRQQKWTYRDPVVPV